MPFFGMRRSSLFSDRRFRPLELWCTCCRRLFSADEFPSPIEECLQTVAYPDSAEARGSERRFPFKHREASDLTHAHKGSGTEFQEGQQLKCLFAASAELDRRLFRAETAPLRRRAATPFARYSLHFTGSFLSVTQVWKVKIFCHDSSALAVLIFRRCSPFPYDLDYCMNFLQERRACFLYLTFFVAGVLLLLAQQGWVPRSSTENAGEHDRDLGKKFFFMLIAESQRQRRQCCRGGVFSFAGLLRRSIGALHPIRRPFIGGAIRFSIPFIPLTGLAFFVLLCAFWASRLICGLRSWSRIT